MTALTSWFREGNEALEISHDHRVQLRAGFWSGIEQSTGTLTTPTP
ncbi:hypothetical protein GTY54_27200 [Streptomyces sp. SID625]|nr:hypothetical protein [Streptomyces sp. SID625]